MLEFLNSQVTPSEHDGVTVYTKGDNSVEVIINEINEPLRVTVNVDDESYVWIHENAASEEDEINARSWGNISYLSFNISDYDNLAYEDIETRAKYVFTGEEQPSDLVVTLYMSDKEKEDITEAAKRLNMSEEDFIVYSLENFIEAQKNEATKS